jgi:hypothetical protein
MGTRRSMAKSSLLARAALTSLLIGLAGSAAASETRCVRGDDAIRRVEIATPDPNQNVPCEVVYWKDTEQPGVRSVLWSAQTDAAFCARKAEELVDTLAGGGWSCAAAGEPQSASRQAPPPQAAASPPSQAAASPPSQGPRSQAGPSSPPSQAAPPQAAVSPPADGAGPDAATASPPPEPESSGSGEAAPAYRAALAPQEGDEGAGGAAVATTLDAIIEQNVVRLNDGVDGKFAAEIAGYGDLDGDALEDGVVFFTYESERLGTARFVAAYLFDGETYALAATKPLAGSDDSVHSAEIETIENGVIALRLNVLEPGDAACCPSGLRRQALVLRSGQLVEPTPAASAESRS